MKSDPWRFTWGGGAVIVLLVLVGVVILLPVYAKTPHTPNATLTDDNYKSLPNLSIEVHEYGVWKRKTTDANGRFDIYGPERMVKGFKLGWTTTHSGSGPFRRYHFNPSGRDRLQEQREMRNAKVKPKR